MARLKIKNTNGEKMYKDYVEVERRSEYLKHSETPSPFLFKLPKLGVIRGRKI